MSDDIYDHVRAAKIGDLIPDDRNANQGTERGDWMLGQSLPRLPVLLLSIAACHSIDLGDLTPIERRYAEGVLAQLGAMLSR